ncbi:MAG: tetratricopeptide repeat protein [Symploca sp. SIO2E6]|nr:tetratricopeptide repeat protein [Symploca sp. SIO2E6]
MSTNTATRLVHITHASGVELSTYLVFDRELSRINQKLKTLRRYLQQYTSGWKKRVEFADLLYLKGNFQEAIKEYRLVLKRQPQLMGIRLKLGKLLQLMGREQEAIEVYKDALLVTTKKDVKYYISGAIASCQGDKLEAIWAFESATSLEPRQAAHWLALGQMQMELENGVAAGRAFDRILSLNPDDIVALIASYDALIAVGNLGKARKRLSRAQKLAPDDYQVLKRVVEYRCRMQLVWEEPGKQTLQLINAALKLAPDTADTQKLLSDYYLARGEWEQGVEVLQQFTEQHPNHPNGWYYYGCSLFGIGESQKAGVAILNAYRLYPNDCEIYRLLSEILPAAGRLEDLRPLLAEMLARFPECWSMWATAGRMLVEQFKEMERGCDVSLQGTQLQPRLPDAWFRHGRVLALAGKHQKAVEALEQGWQYLEEEWISLSVPAAVWLLESYRVLGNTAASRKWLAEAKVRSQQLLEFDPATAYYWQRRALEGY